MATDALIINRQGRPTLISVIGEIDLATRPQFEEALAQLFGADGDSRLDLRGVTFMDTRSVTAVVHCARRLHEEGGRLVVHHPPESLLRIYRLLWARQDDSRLFISGVRGEP